MENPFNSTSWDPWPILITQLHDIYDQSTLYIFVRSMVNLYNFMRSMVNPLISTSWDPWSNLITQLHEIDNQSSSLNFQEIHDKSSQLNFSRSMINPNNTTSWDTWSIVISQLHDIQDQSWKFNFLRSVINPYNSTSWDRWSIFITQLLDIYDEFSYWPWISWSYAMRTDHGSHEVAWWGLTMDLMKLCYENWS